MKRFLLIGPLSIVLALSGAVPALAQRTAAGKVFVGATQHVSCYSIPSGGASLEAGQYLVRSLWKVGVRAVDWNQRFSGSDGGGQTRQWFDHILWNLSGEWMYRIACTYGRTFNVYLGAGAFVGLNQYEVFRPLPPEISPDFGKVEFVYGAQPALEAELFPFRAVAIVLGVQSPFTFGSSLKTDLWHLSASLGVRINL